MPAAAHCSCGAATQCIGARCPQPSPAPSGAVPLGLAVGALMSCWVLWDWWLCASERLSLLGLAAVILPEQLNGLKPHIFFS